MFAGILLPRSRLAASTLLGVGGCRETLEGEERLHLVGDLGKYTGFGRYFLWKGYEIFHLDMPM
jgi:hypothetical protein